MADPPSVASPSVVVQSTPVAESDSVSTDSLVVGVHMEEAGSLAGLSGGDDNILDSFSLDSISTLFDVNIEQSTGNVEQNITVQQSRSNVVQSMANDKDDKVNKPSTVEQNTVNVEQSTSNILQSNNNVEQSIDVVVLSLGLNLYRPLKILLHKRILKK